MELLGVVIGGALAIAGGAIAQAVSAKAARDEAHRERVEGFRHQCTVAAVAAFDTIQQARPDAVTLWGSHDDMRRRIEQLHETEREAARLLLAISVGRPGGQDTEAVADAAEELRRKLRVTTGQTAVHAGTIIRNSPDNIYDEAQKANDVARDTLASFEDATRKLGQERRARAGRARS